MPVYSNELDQVRVGKNFANYKKKDLNRGTWSGAGQVKLNICELMTF